MADYEDVYAPDLTEETESTLSGSEQFVMFDAVEGKRAELSTIADYIVENGEIDGSDIPTIVSNIEGNIGTVDTKVGDLTDLETTDKTNIVSAVNEVNGKAEDADEKADTVDEHVGVLSDLETEDKTSAVDAINEVLSKIPVMTKEVTGNPIVVDDALGEVQSLNVELEPVQDLRGYDKPWAGGAGKNKFNINNLTNTTDITVSNGVITVTNNARNSGKKLGELADLTIGESYTLSAESTGAAGTKLIYLYGTDANVTWSFGNTLTMTQAYLDALVMFYGGDGQTAQITDFMIRPSSVADASWTPYSNICPITGHDSVTVGVTGVNQWDEEWEEGYFDISTGQPISYSTISRSKNFIPILPNTTYYYKSNSANHTLLYYDASYGYISNSAYGSSSQTFTTPSNARYMKFAFVGTTYNNDISINYPSTDTAYHAYYGHSTTVTLPSTVYGGTVGVINGEGKEKVAYLKLNTANMDNNNDYPGWRTSGIKDIIGAEFNSFITNGFTNVSPKDTNAIGANTVSNNDMLLLNKNYFGKTQTEWQALAMDIEFLIPLTAPLDLSTTPTDITLYNGDNVVSSDGDMDMVYVRDIIKVIEKLEG